MSHSIITIIAQSEVCRDLYLEGTRGTNPRSLIHPQKDTNVPASNSNVLRVPDGVSDHMLNEVSDEVPDGGLDHNSAMLQ